MNAPKSRWFWPLAALLFLADCTSKRMVVDELGGAEHIPREVIGNALRFNLTYNPGIAFSLHLGDYSRVVFSVVAVVVLAVLMRMYFEAHAHDRMMGAALGLIVGGAFGNLYDRLRWARGVVDFIDVGLGDVRFWVFNLADAGVSVGAVLLLYVMLHRARTTDPESV